MPDVRLPELSLAGRVGLTYVDAPMNYLADLSVKPVTPQSAARHRRAAPRRPTTRTSSCASTTRDPTSGELFARPAGLHPDPPRHQGPRLLRRARAQTAYYREVEALIKRETGAGKVVVFDHTVRTADRAVERGLRTPVRSVHNDYTEKSGPQRVRDLLPPDEAEARLMKKRFAEYNVWRNIDHEPIEMSPLGFVDAQSIAPRDLAVWRPYLRRPDRRDLPGASTTPTTSGTTSRR